MIVVNYNDHPRRVLVTGGHGGIGREICSAFEATGDEVVRTGRAPRRDDSTTVALDLDKPASVEQGAQEALARLGGLDTLVLNAVRWPQATSDRLEDLPAAAWRAVLRANVEGNFLLCQRALPALRASVRGRIVLLSSGSAEEGQPPHADYITAKSALHGLCRALAWHAGPDGVLVNVVAAGFTRTANNAERVPPELFARAGRLSPQGRVSDAAAVAALVHWLGSDDNASMTGEILREGTSNARTALVALR